MDTRKVLKQCKFSRRYQGYRELQECLRIVLDDEERLLRITEVYLEAGQKFDISWNGVEKNIRTALTRAWERGGKEEMEHLFGGEFFEIPTVGETIEMFAEYIKDHSGEAQAM